MTAKEIVEAALAALDIFIGWPVVILIVVLLFRKQIEQLFSMLGVRLRRLSIGGASAEFETASELFSQSLREVTRPRVPSERVGEPEEFPNEQELRSEMPGFSDERDDRSRNME